MSVSVVSPVFIGRRDEMASLAAHDLPTFGDPRLPGLMSVQPSSTSPVADLLDVNRWLERSGVTIR